VLVTFWGVRGSYPIARRDNIRYGGNSTCVQIQALGEEPLIMDGGSGIRVLGSSLMDGPCGKGQGCANILVGHTHWDHILGYPFFGPLYFAGNRFRFYSAGQSEAELPLILEGQHEGLHFPVPFVELRAEMVFERIRPGERFTVGGYSVQTVQLNHPGITLGYRVEHADAAVVIFTDTARIAHVQQGDGMEQAVEREGLEAFQRRFHQDLVDLCQGADLLVHDSHFLEGEIVGKEHWGHSTALDALALAREARVRHLMLFHHAPEHPDAVVDQKLADTRKAAQGSGVQVSAAREGMAVELSEGKNSSGGRGGVDGTQPLRPTGWEDTRGGGERC
jgi:ribonuclease BN (tRNA processing enzyme)